MKKNKPITLIALIALQAVFSITQAQSFKTSQIAPGVKKIEFGTPDKFTPYYFSDQKPHVAAMEKLPSPKLPFHINHIQVNVNNRGVVVEIPLADDEQLYGFGLQIGSFNQRGLRVKPIVNDNPLNDLGYTHAPANLYWSNKGYGILINTSRYTTFYCGSTNKLGNQSNVNKSGGGSSVEELYKNDRNASGYVVADIPGTKGIEIFIFEGPDMFTALQRYNLFSGGGALPAIWGMGVKYRVKADFNQQQVEEMASYFRKKKIPCDVIGLEPDWQTKAYSCSYVWNKKLFPSSQTLIDNLKQKGFKINLWEHAFVNPESPLYEPLKNRAGNYLVWNGLVPDFADATTSKMFGDYHKENLVKQGIAGFKMDECDNSNLAYGSATWSFPEHSAFPSGIDGEQMHQVFGVVYQKSIYNVYRELNQRTYLDVRASNAFASPYPSALYSDTYHHNEYIRMVANSGFAGLLWSPEVRESSSVKDLIRRSQTAVLSAQCLYNAWYLKNPPWLQINIDKNTKGELMTDAAETEAIIQQLLNLRMSLVPYLYNAFADYHFKGIPPFRALVVDYPDDKKVYTISDQYMIGESILAAPLTANADNRKVYLPAGNWYDFNTGQKYEGGKEYNINIGYTQLPIFIKEGTILPLAKPVEYINAETKFELTCRVYGKKPINTTLFEDDGITFNYEKNTYNLVHLSYNKGKGTSKRIGNFKQSRYVIKGWKFIN